MSKNLILIGGGGHCKSCIDVIEQENKYHIYGILDLPNKIGQKILDYKIIGTDNDIENFIQQGFSFLITIGQLQSPKLRIMLYEKIKSAHGHLATIISPRAYVSKHAQIGEGTIIMHDALVNAGVTIGTNCIINTKALIEHECVIGNNCHIAIGTVLAGETKVGCGSFIGANSTLVQQSHIPSNSFIKAGALIK